MSSGRTTHVRAALLAVGLALMVCGCTSTQTTAARLQLNDARIRAGEEPVRVQTGETSRTVVVSTHTIIFGHGVYLAVATLRNDSDRAVSDLPISVGYRSGARTIYLNAVDTNLTEGYFDNHIPSIPAHGSLTWVDSGRAKRPRGARTFVLVGSRPAVPVSGFTPPIITVKQATGSGAQPARGHRLITAELTNQSSIPQYELPVYAVVARDGQIVGGSSRLIADLSGGAQAVVRLSLPAVDEGDGFSVRVEAPATIFK